MTQRRGRLTPPQVLAMRERAAQGVMAKVIAWEFDVSRSTARDVTTGRTHAQVGGVVQRHRWSRVSAKESREIGLFMAMGGSNRRAQKIFGRSHAAVRRHADLYRQNMGKKEKKDHDNAN